MKEWSEIDRGAIKYFLTLSLIVLASCGGDDGEPEPEPVGPEPVTISVEPSMLRQEMIGFGGALTWYSNWMTSSSNKNAIANLIFSDLGIDIIRFKNWYYPDNYPTVTTTSVMTDDNSKIHWDATNELHTLAKTGSPNVKILLSSWGPPQSLKSNNSTRQGTLKKDGAVFMYDAYADYWEDVLDNVPFNPDYISIQNEPTYINAGWTTCQWSFAETAALPDYHIAFDKVYDKIKDRAHVPVMIGPESQDIPTYSAFANILKNKTHCGVLAYHPYNLNAGSSSDQVISSLQTIGAINAKPNIMSEFSDNLDWFNTALFIHRSLVYGNTSGYIYWKLVWATPSSGTDAGMVSVNASGQYTVTPFYYLIKHFSKHIDAGYRRVDVSSTSTSLNLSAFLSPDGKKVTVVAVNSGSGSVDVDLSVTGKTISAMMAEQSVEGLYYTPVTITTDGAMSIPPRSITTVVLDI
jgi:glucuronoarabinoxylan endo-1,4-beta-xylanase